MPKMGLKDKVAIVTGAGSRGDGIGNGRAAAILLAREGAKVALLDAMKEWAEATKAMIDAEGGTSMIVVADVARSGFERGFRQGDARRLGPARHSCQQRRHRWAHRQCGRC